MPFIEGFNKYPNAPKRRPAGIPTTSVTNELADAIFAMESGDVGYNEGRFGAPYKVVPTGNATGAGKYTCKAYIPNANYHNPAVDLHSGDIMAITIFEDAIFINLAEADTSGHTLTDPANEAKPYYPADFDGWTAEVNPRAVFSGYAYPVVTCTT